MSCYPDLDDLRLSIQINCRILGKNRVYSSQAENMAAARDRRCVLLISKPTCLGKLPHLTFLLELEFVKHQQILQILGHCLVLFLFNVNMPSCPSLWRRVSAWGEGYSTNIWVWQHPQILLPCLGQTTKSTLSCFKTIYCMTKLLQECKFVL